MGTLEERLQRLEDRDVIRDLIAMYSIAVDARNVEALAHILTEDYFAEHSGGLTFDGRDALTTTLSRAPEGMPGMGHITPLPHIVIDGDRAVATFHTAVLRSGESGFVTDRLSANRVEFVRTGEGWKIKRRLNLSLDGTPEAPALLGRLEEGPSPA